MDMGNVGRVAVGFFGLDVRRINPLRLLGWYQKLAKLDGGGDGEHGGQHGDSSAGAGGRRDDCLDGNPQDRPARFSVQLDPPDILGGIALIGLLAYALLRGMDATIAGMLTGLFGVLLGRSTKSNGKK